MTELAVIGWIFGGVCFGLWLGERGRRKDLQWIAEAAAGPIPRGQDRGPVIEPRSTQLEDAERVEEFQIEEVAAGILEAAQAQGKDVSMDDARSEAKRILVETERYGGYDP